MEQEEPGQGNARMELHQCALPAGSWPNPGRQRHSGCSALHRGRSGEERGRTIGFPTANLGSDIAGYIPVDGVYAGWLVDGENRWPAAISIGTKPTFSEKTGLNERVVEAYCITEEWIDLYDHKVRVEFVGFLRPQVKFDGPDQLVDELKRNVEETKRLTA